MSMALWNEVSKSEMIFSSSDNWIYSQEDSRGWGKVNRWWCGGGGRQKNCGRFIFEQLTNTDKDKKITTNIDGLKLYNLDL